jgi:hypothetical protein
VNLVFINAGAAGTIDEDVLRGILALSPIVSFRIHVTPGGSPPSLMPFMTGTGLYGFIYANNLPDAVAIVIPRLAVPRMNADFPIPESKEARRARDANLTKWLNDEYRPSPIGANLAGVFGHPDAVRSKAAYLEAARDIAKLIVGRARGKAPLPQADAIAVFETTAAWVQRREILNDFFPMESIMLERAIERLKMLRDSLIAEYREEVRHRLRQGYPKLESDVEDESVGIAEKAVGEFQRKVKALPELLREQVRLWEIRFYSGHIRETLIQQIPLFVQLHQIEQQKKPNQLRRRNLAQLLDLV